MKTDGSDQNTKGTAPVAAAKPMTEEERARKTMQGRISNMAKEFERALPGKIGVERMMRIVMTAILKNPTLALCEPTSFMGSLLQALQLGLEVNTPLGQAYLIPRKKKDRNGNYYWECTLQIGYQGLLDVCYRYGAYKMITAEVVYEGDYFDYRYGTKQFLDHRPEGKKDANPLWVWALYQLENGGERFVAWTWEKALARGEEFSDSFNKDKPWASPWLSGKTSQEEMAKKSVLKALLKYAPKSVEGRVEAATYTDGRAVVAETFEEGGNMKLSFDVEPPATPIPEQLTSRNDGAGGPPEEEPEPMSWGSAEDSAQAATAVPLPRSAAAESRSAPPPQTAGNGTAHRRGALFPADEAEDLEGSVELPVFR
jgi:recombination protein RecT